MTEEKIVIIMNPETYEKGKYKKFNKKFKDYMKHLVQIEQSNEPPEVKEVLRKMEILAFTK